MQRGVGHGAFSRTSVETPSKAGREADRRLAQFDAAKVRQLGHFAEKGKLESVERLLAENEPGLANAPCSDTGRTALGAASMKGRLDVVRALVEAGADLEARGRDGETALIWAVQWRKPEVARFLLEQGADVAARTKHGVCVFDFEVLQDIDLSSYLPSDPSREPGSIVESQVPDDRTDLGFYKAKPEALTDFDMPADVLVASFPRWARVALVARHLRRLDDLIGGLAWIASLAERLEQSAQTKRLSIAGRGDSDAPKGESVARRTVDDWQQRCSAARAEGATPPDPPVPEYIRLSVHTAIDAATTPDSTRTGLLTAAMEDMVMLVASGYGLMLRCRLGFIRDRCTIMGVSGREAWSDETPVPPTVFGPLWVDGPDVEPAPAETPGAGDDSSGCFIATACCGSSSHMYVQQLRWWRDHVLSKSALGTVICQLYAAASPPLARGIRKCPPVAWLLRAVLIAPAARIVKRRYPGRQHANPSIAFWRNQARARVGPSPRSTDLERHSRL